MTDGSWWIRPDLRYKSSTLHFGGARLEAFTTGTPERPVYVYRPERAVEKAGQLRAVLPEAAVLYAVKANRHPQILRQMLQSVDGIDVCSPNEARLALQNLFPPDRISYTGTSLSESDVDFLVEYDTIHVNVDSLSCLRRLAARCPGRTLGIRVNPERGIGYRNEARLVYSASDRPSKLGLLAEQIPEALAIAREHFCRIDTVHWHVGCGWLNGQLDDLREILRRTTSLAATVPGLERINLGGGLGVPLQADDAPLALERWAAIVRETVAGRWAITVEPGSFLVQDVGVLLARVNTVEKKRDWTFVGVNAGFNLLMEPVFYGMPVEPVFVNLPEADRPRERVTIAGNINEAHDLFAQDHVMPLPREGEWLAFLNAGAYAASMSSDHCLRGDYDEETV